MRTLLPNDPAYWMMDCLQSDPVYWVMDFPLCVSRVNHRQPVVWPNAILIRQTRMRGIVVFRVAPNASQGSRISGRRLRAPS